MNVECPLSFMATGGFWPIVLIRAQDANCSNRCEPEDLRRSPESINFPHDTVRVELMDESVVEFRSALVVVNEAKKAIAVFTEHCGHHVLPFHQAKVFVGDELRYSQGSS